MRNALRNDLSVERALAHRNKLGKRTKRKRQYHVESLESRTLLSYTFSYVGTTATALGTTGADSLVIAPIGGLLEYSVGGAAFNSNWGTVAVPVTVPVPGVTAVNVTLESGDGASLQLGGNSGANVGGPASATLGAAFILTVPVVNTTDTVVIDDSASTAATTYRVNTGLPGGPTFPITGLGINFQEPTGIANGGITLKGSSGVDTYNVLSTYYFSTIGSEPVTIDGGASSGNVVNVGSNPLTSSSSTLGNILAPVSVTDPTGSATLNLLDAGDPTSADANITGSTVTGLGFGLGSSVAYTGGATTGVTALNIYGGTSASGDAGINYTVDGTTAATTLNTGPNADTVNVLATGTSAPLTIHGNDGADTVNIGNAGSVLGILGDVHIDNTFDFTAINTDASADTNGHNALLQGESPAELTGVAPANIFYTASQVSSLSLTMGDASLSSNSNNLTIDFSTGNPIPSEGAIGLAYNAGNGLANTLNLQGDLPAGLGGPGFASEVHNANDPFHAPNGQYGSIAFVDQNSTPTELTYAGLTPINDTANATNYTFNDFADDQSFTAQNGPTVLGLNTVQFVNTPALPPPTFETTNVANKTNIVFNTPSIGTPLAITGVVNIPTAATGLLSLQFNIGNGNDQVTVTATPSIANFGVALGNGDDVVNINGFGLAPRPIYQFDGGPGFNTLNYDSGTQPVGFTLDTITFNGVVINYVNFEVINALTLNVINTNDSRAGSLRQALITANGHAGPDTITFAIPGPGVHTISPLSALPTITDQVNLDGSTERTFLGLPAAGPPVVQINGNGLSGDGLVLGSRPAGASVSGTSSAGSAIIGLDIYNFGGSGIHIQTTGNMITDNFLGTDVNGTAAGPGNNQGVLIDTNASGNTIGGTGAGAGNVISGNSVDGIDISSDGNLVQGNKIGTNAAGTAALGNTYDGISLNNASSNSITGNVVSGNGINKGNQDAAGINLEANDSNNTIAGNEIGTNAAGDAMLGNSLHGIFLGNGSSNNTIGGPTDNDRNVISGNGQFPVANLYTQGGVGVYIYGANTSGNVVQGNYIGTNAAGIDALTNSVIGVLISQSFGNTVQGNLISGNRFVGVEIAGSTATGNKVQGNMIGTDAGGTRAIPNGRDGIFINDAPNNTIGGTAPGTGNLISANLSAGIQIYGAGATNNQIFRNRIGLDANGRPTLPNGMKPLVTGIFSQISINANDFGFSTVNQNLGQVLPWQSPSTIGGGTVSGASQAAVAAHRKASFARSVSGHHGPLSKRKTVIVTAVHSYPNAKLALGLSRKSPGLG